MMVILLMTPACSIHYILSLWERLISSVPFVRLEEAHNLDAYAPRITRAYIMVHQ